MEHLSRLNIHARLAIALGLSLCVHLAILFLLSSPPAGSGHNANVKRHGKLSLTVILPSSQPGNARKPPPDKAAVDIKIDRAAPPGSAAPLGMGRRFFNLAELDQRPGIVQDIPGDPPELQNYPQGGRLVMRLWIDESGKVAAAEAISSELPAAFVESARNSFLKATFSPGRKFDRPVASVMDVVINYAPILP